ncbi:MAG: CoA ester lyase [Rectinemataceae bacterium]
MFEYPMRSLMFVPGHNEKLMRSAAKSDADVLLLDLEDSVQPASNKAIARSMIKTMVSEGIFNGRILIPRVNDRESGNLLKDVHELTIPGISGFMYPKSKTSQDIYFFDKLLETIEYEKGIPRGTYKIIPLIETASAVLNVNSICAASSRIIAVAFGCEDYISDLEGIHDLEGTSIFTARAMIAMAAKANNIAAIDTVHINVHDLEDLEKNLIVAKRLGFDGMLVLHPKELELVHRYFTPLASEVENAEKILQLYEIAEKENKGVAIMDGKFIGPPMVIHAKKVLQRHRTIRSRYAV